MANTYLNMAGTTELVSKIKSWANGAFTTLSAVKALGYQTAANVKSTVESYGYTTLTAVKNLGYQTAANVKTTVEGYGYQTAANVTTIVEGKGYATTTSMNTAITNAKSDMQSAIDSAVSSAYKVKGTCTFANLPALSSAKIGDVWNVSDAFSTTSDFVEGTGKSYPAGSNVVRVNVSNSAKWDVLAGVYDMSGYMKSSDMVAITTTEVDNLFA